jgi:hypothetical protein
LFAHGNPRLIPHAPSKQISGHIGSVSLVYREPKETQYLGEKGLLEKISREVFFLSFRELHAERNTDLEPQSLESALYSFAEKLAFGWRSAFSAAMRLFFP